MNEVSDHAALPDRVLNLYLWPVGAWGAALLVLYLTGYAAYAIPLCYLVAVWQIALSAWWGRSLLRRLRAGEITLPEAHAGVKSVGRILAGSSLAPAIVFLANDPLAPSAWSTTAGALVVAGLALGAVTLFTRVSGTASHALAIAFACLAMPLNATGAVTVASLTGLYDVVVDTAPIPEEMKPPIRTGKRPERDRPRR